jgi:hypothetical protein
MIRTVTFQNGFCFPKEDIVVIRREENQVELALPFLPDTPNLQMSVSDAYTLRNALNEVLDVRSLPSPENKK